MVCDILRGVRRPPNFDWAGTGTERAATPGSARFHRMRSALKSLLPERMLATLRRASDLIRTRHPVTFNEKIRYKIHRDRRPLLVTFADKVAARDFVAQQHTECALPRVYAITYDLATIDRSSLPRELVVKVSHTSGGVVVVCDEALPGGPTPRPADGLITELVHPDTLDWSQLIETTSTWLRGVYRGPFGEWAYAQITPRIVIEELLRDEQGMLPKDYKCHVFNGRCRMIEVAVNRFGGYTELRFTPSWELIPDGPGRDEEAAAGLAAPARLDALIRIAEQLGRDTDYVRVDLYVCPGRIVFGELTNYSGGGQDVATAAADLRIGAFWTVPKRYRDLPQG